MVCVLAHYMMVKFRRKKWEIIKLKSSDSENDMAQRTLYGTFFYLPEAAPQHAGLE
jgi:hypothetical protein